MLLSIDVISDVISDVICPWCFIGKRRLERAIAALNGQYEVRVRWHAFQLNPTMPKEGISRREYRIQKFGSWERSMQLDANIIAVGNEEGIDFAFDKMERTPNTFDAHRLIWLADQHDCQDEVVENLSRAYFTDGRDISNQQTRIDVVAEAGLDRQLAVNILDGDEGVSAIQNAEELSRRYGVSGVPFFIINEKVALSGARAPVTFLEAFRQAEAMKQDDHSHEN